MENHKLLNKYKKDYFRKVSLQIMKGFNWHLLDVMINIMVYLMGWKWWPREENYTTLNACNKTILLRSFETGMLEIFYATHINLSSQVDYYLYERTFHQDYHRKAFVMKKFIRWTHDTKNSASLTKC